MESLIVSLETAAKILSVPVETLLKWNEYNILKPTITSTGQVGYRQEQISQFIAIQKRPSIPESLEPEFSTTFNQKIRSLYIAPVFALVLSFISTIVVSQIIMFKYLPYQPEKPTTILTSQIINKTDPIQTKITVDPELINKLNTNNLTYSDITNFTPDTDKNDSVFDTGSILKGENTNADVLATTILGGGVIQSPGQGIQPADPKLFLFLLTLCLLFLPFIFKKQPINNQKVLELIQKNDGSVVLCFQDREYKISKPELDSESDQFIERLMDLVKTGIKEIDYDASKDGMFSLSAPLSKLVTRLGFVGIKRDLFFPRTSKNRVLFRRYLTREDLSSMNLSINRLSNEILAR